MDRANEDCGNKIREAEIAADTAREKISDIQRLIYGIEY